MLVAPNVPSQMVKHSHIGISIIEVVGVGWVVFLCPVGWQWAVKIENVMLGFGLVIHAVKAHNLLTNTQHIKLSLIKCESLYWV